ncbi:MAG TPA: DUF1499 domain-containing protein [Spirochaetia bacterium]|nr:DUF1499 domain-containing protein [Spirochaetia bacterium]
MKRFVPLFLGTVIFGGCSSQAPTNLGVHNGRLASCPPSPNCVSTQGEDPQHRIEPLSYSGSSEQTMEKILRMVKGSKRTRVITSESNYLHAEYRTGFFGFVDDVEFYLDDDSKTVHFRSASRVGYSDLGVNRKRMEEFRKAYLSPP